MSQLDAAGFALHLHIMGDRGIRGYLERIRGIDRIAQEAGLSIPQLAIAWVLRDPVVTTAIIGASRTSQIDDAVAASQVTLSDAVITALEEFAAPVGGSVG